VTSFSVPAGALGAWQRRLNELGLEVRERAARFGEEALTVTDPSGLVVDLVGTQRDDRTPWVSASGGPDAGTAIRGIHGVTLTIRDPARSLGLLTDVLGFRVIDEAADRTRLAVGSGVPGTLVEVVRAPDAPAAMNGLGTVHHVAFAVPDADAQLRMRAELVRLGLAVTEVLDRQYFRSIYFREPGGVLFEIATVPPGFTVDETPEDLGAALKLPPWEEPNRPSIEAHLPKVTL
jgi:glyoxalase family protein